MDRASHCARVGCGAPASASFSYEYAARAAWLDDLAGDDDPHAYGLCLVHADSLTVPVGWILHDRRTLPIPLPVEVVAG